MDPKDRLIFALDVATRGDALRLVRQLRDEVSYFKLGLELYLGLGPKILGDLAKQERVGPEKIFLDLKLYDIPATVLGALTAITHGVAWVTVPSDLGLTGLQKIVAGTARKVLAVTVLTSTTADDLKKLGFAPELAADPEKLVVHKARLAQEAGCAGVVSSGREVQAVKQACGPDFLVVCPGIRPLGPGWPPVPRDDQKRVVTPYEAIKHGADYLVVGRPIRNYPEADGGPVAAARRVVAEIRQAMSA
jgi:orotidine-5'-phosphate decarboxylase